MLEASTTTKFIDEVEKSRKSGKDMSKLREIIKKLTAELPLDRKHRNHKLKGGYKGR